MPCPRGRSEWEDVVEDEGEPIEEVEDLGGADSDDEENDPTTYPRFLTVVSVTGFFRHKVAWCHCPKAPKAAIQLFREQLFPATQQRPQTAFTFDVLDHFWVDMMECKTSNHGFIRKLARITNRAFPQNVPVSPSLRSFNFQRCCPILTMHFLSIDTESLCMLAEHIVT